MPTKPKRKRLVYGRDWHGWCWRYDLLGVATSTFSFRDLRPLIPKEFSKGHWVRVSVKEVGK